MANGFHHPDSSHAGAVTVRPARRNDAGRAARAGQALVDSTLSGFDGEFQAGGPGDRDQLARHENTGVMLTLTRPTASSILIIKYA